MITAEVRKEVIVMKGKNAKTRALKGGKIEG